MPPAIKNDLDQLNAPITLAKQTNFVCPYENCGNTYKRKAKLIEHERVHTGERPFVCTYPGCGKTYRRSTNLSAHTRTHEPEAARPFHCSHEGCTKSFLSLSHLNRHEKTHGVPIFKVSFI
ncbi:hypothetical protein K492DRAFT_159399 [Lichtheimia hyalospora FSU 10163]|nr:hypothetical protein K492DRAFT_159399 [Lichtheimia hyalospora FSU 10163]